MIERGFLWKASTQLFSSAELLCVLKILGCCSCWVVKIREGSLVMASLFRWLWRFELCVVDVLALCCRAGKIERKMIAFIIMGSCPILPAPSSPPPDFCRLCHGRFAWDAGGKLIWFVKLHTNFHKYVFRHKTCRNSRESWRMVSNIHSKPILPLNTNPIPFLSREDFPSLSYINNFSLSVFIWVIIVFFKFNFPSHFSACLKLHLCISYSFLFFLLHIVQ